MNTTNPPKAKQTHTHVFTRSKPTATVETCTCGKFRFTENAGEPIVAQDKTAKAKRAKSETTKVWREFADKYGPDLAKEHTPDETPEAPKAKRADARGKADYPYHSKCEFCGALVPDTRLMIHEEWCRTHQKNAQAYIRAEQDKTAHTPGPWKAQPARYADFDAPHHDWSVTTEGRYLAIAFVQGKDKEANARLIAASPIMFDYLSKLANKGDIHAAKIIANI